jgi:hypothetical protein
MKIILGLLAILLVSMSIIACGSAGSTARTTATVAHKDRDNDSDNGDDDNKVLYYGKAPDPAEHQQLVTLLTGYFAAAAAEDGAKACTLLIPFMAESVVEKLRQGPGLSGNTCAAAMTKIFAQHHPELIAKSATLKFYSVRVGTKRALIVLSFSGLPEVRTMLALRDSGGNWKVLTLLDGFLE